MKKTIMRSSWRSALIVGTAVALAGPIAAQETAGSIAGWVTADGDPAAGVEVQLQRLEAGVDHQATADASGHFRFLVLPPGDYEVRARADGGLSARWRGPVNLGRTTRVELRLAPGTQEAATPGHAAAPDTASADSSRTVSLDLLAARLPVAREMTPVVLLEPGSVLGDAGFNSGYDGLWLYTPGQQYAAVGGGSIAENRTFIDGLEVTNLRDGLGSTMVPFGFVEQAQIAQGGWSSTTR